MEQSIKLISFIYHGLPAYHFGENFFLLDLIISHTIQGTGLVI